MRHQDVSGGASRSTVEGFGEAVTLEAVAEEGRALLEGDAAKMEGRGQTVGDLGSPGHHRHLHIVGERKARIARSQPDAQCQTPLARRRERCAG